MHVPSGHHASLLRDDVRGERARGSVAREVLRLAFHDTGRRPRSVLLDALAGMNVYEKNVMGRRKEAVKRFFQLGADDVPSRHSCPRHARLGLPNLRTQRTHRGKVTQGDTGLG